MILLILLVIGFTIYFYSIKCLDAPITPAARLFMVSCRFIFLGILLLLLTKPLIREINRISYNTTLFLALDDTVSMAYPVQPEVKEIDSKESSRWETVQKNLQNEGILDEWSRAGFDVRFGLFSELSRTNTESSFWSSQIPSSASPSFSYTDLSAAIEAFQRGSDPESSAYLLLFTDGQWNRGKNPKANVSTIFSASDSSINPLTHRIYSFGIGTGSEIFDLFLESVVLPSKARSGEPLILRAQLQSRGEAIPGSIEVRVRGGIKNGGETYYQERSVSLSDQQKSAALLFEIPPLEPGDYLFHTEITPQEGELFQNNNAITSGVRIRKSKEPILILTGAPDWEFKFMKQVLEEYEGIDPYAYLIHENGLSYLSDRQWVKGQTGQEPEMKDREFQTYSTLEDIQADLNRFSLVIFHNFPFQALTTNFAGAIRNFVEDGKGIVMIPGPHNTSAPPPNLREVLPAPLFQLFASARQQVIAQVDGKDRTLLQAALGNMSPEDLPPLYPYYRTGAPLPGSLNLLEGLTSIKEPVRLVSLHRFGLGRIIIMHTNSFWKWNLLTGKDVLSPFWLSLLFQCNPSLQMTPGQLYTDGYIYQTDEPVRVSYAAKDRIQDTTVSGIEVTVHGPERKETLWLEPSESQLHLYEAAFTPVDEGDYTLVTAIQDATAEFRVEPSTLELNNLSQNISGLREIAEAGGGEYANEPAWQSLARNLPKAEHVVEKEQTRFLGEKWWIFLSMILFLTLEWFIRRQQGLP